MKAFLAALLAASSLATAVQAQSAGYKTIDPENLLVIEATKGKVLVELRPDVAPLAVERMKALVRKGFFEGDTFYRVQTGYVAQTGAKSMAEATTSGMGPIKDEFTFAAPAGLPADGGFLGSMAVARDGNRAWGLFCPGTASMAHYADANSGDSQFFFAIGRAAQMDKLYTPWGRVVSGLYALRLAAPGEPPANPDHMLRIRVAADIPVAERPTAAVATPDSPAMVSAVAHMKSLMADKYTPCAVEVPVQVQWPAPAAAPAPAAP